MRGGHALPSDGTSGQSSLPPSQLLYFSKIQIQKFGKFRLLELFPDHTIINHDVIERIIKTNSGVVRACPLYGRCVSFDLRGHQMLDCLPFWQNSIVVSKLLLLVSSKKRKTTCQDQDRCWTLDFMQKDQGPNDNATGTRRLHLLLAWILENE